MRYVKLGKITKIEIQKYHKDRVSIFLDDVYAFSLFLETAMKHCLKKGIEIDENQKVQLLHESDSRIALDQAVKYLKDTMKTKQQMIEYVKKHGYDDNIIDYVVQKLEEYHYLDDEMYTQKYIKTYLGKVGKRKIEYDLMKKGIDKHLIEKYLSLEEVSTDQVVHLIEKKIGNNDLDQKMKEKIFRYLIGKGFSYEEIKKGMAHYQTGEEDESWD